MQQSQLLAPPRTVSVAASSWFWKYISIAYSILAAMRAHKPAMMKESVLLAFVVYSIVALLSAIFSISITTPSTSLTGCRCFWHPIWAPSQYQGRRIVLCELSHGCSQVPKWLNLQLRHSHFYRRPAEGFKQTSHPTGICHVIQ